jgi:hypothetical protein
MATNGAYYSNSSGLDLTSGSVVRLNIATSGGITFNNDYTFPTADGGANEALITDGAGNVNFGTIPNIYRSSGTLNSDRLVNQGGFDLSFDTSGSEVFNVYKTTSTVINRPRLRVEADDSYGTVLELKTADRVVPIVEGYDNLGGLIFSVDGGGNLTANSKSFLIPHPSKEGYSLRYGSLEGPEHGVYVRGKLEGTNTIKLPSYWLDLVDEDTITVQLTPIGSHQNLYVKDVLNNTIVIGNSNILSSKIKCFYLVQAERKDISKMVVEYSNTVE